MAEDSFAGTRLRPERRSHRLIERGRHADHCGSRIVQPADVDACRRRRGPIRGRLPALLSKLVATEAVLSFVSVTQSFNTTTSMGRLTLNVLLSFAQFEREVTGERIRDMIAASKKKGMWMGGMVPLGYRVEDRALHIVEDHAEIVRSLFRRYLESGSVVRLKQQLDAEAFRIPIRIDGAGRSTGGGVLSRGQIYKILSNAIYIGRIAHRGQVHEGQHSPIVPQELWDQAQQRLRDHQGGWVPSRLVLEFVGGSSGDMRLSDHAARSMI
jgi:Recombinase/Resolvase, N terminal domain